MQISAGVFNPAFATYRMTVTAGPWTTLVATVALQSVALLGLYVFGTLPAVAVAMIGLAGLAFAAFTTALGGRVLRLAPGRSDLPAAMLSAAVNVGITGGLVLPSHGVRSTVLIGVLLGFAALALAITERLALPHGSRRTVHPLGDPRRQPRSPAQTLICWCRLYHAEAGSSYARLQRWFVPV
ncbi:MFS transporter [Actinoplanes solisilvae]|uniref:MFS transporter n=1 Tax=Actinoplanes solisilvae TaxID=2486853 RepID=UPI000FDCD54C|nr:MFS transporter [Actinoplanes solisilvae]